MADLMDVSWAWPAPSANHQRAAPAVSSAHLSGHDGRPARGALDDEAAEPRAMLKEPWVRLTPLLLRPSSARGGPLT
jgi:hypothetical protein